MSSPPWGHVAEWLRNGLQNRVHQFNSGRGLHSITLIVCSYFKLLIHHLFRPVEMQPDLQLCLLSLFHLEL